MRAVSAWDVSRVLYAQVYILLLDGWNLLPVEPTHLWLTLWMYSFIIDCLRLTYKRGQNPNSLDIEFQLKGLSVSRNRVVGFEGVVGSEL